MTEEQEHQEHQEPFFQKDVYIRKYARARVFTIPRDLLLIIEANHGKFENVRFKVKKTGKTIYNKIRLIWVSGNSRVITFPATIIHEIGFTPEKAMISGMLNGVMTLHITGWDGQIEMEPVFIKKNGRVK